MAINLLGRSASKSRHRFNDLEENLRSATDWKEQVNLEAWQDTFTAFY